MGQAHVRARGVEQVRDPIPAIRRLEHHLRIGSGLSDLTPTRSVVLDADRRKRLPTSSIRTTTDRR